MKATAMNQPPRLPWPTILLLVLATAVVASLGTATAMLTTLRRPIADRPQAVNSGVPLPPPPVDSNRPEAEIVWYGSSPEMSSGVVRNLTDRDLADVTITVHAAVIKDQSGFLSEGTAHKKAVWQSLQQHYRPHEATTPQESWMGYQGSDPAGREAFNRDHERPYKRTIPAGESWHFDVYAGNLPPPPISLTITDRTGREIPVKQRLLNSETAPNTSVPEVLDQPGLIPPSSPPTPGPTYPYKGVPH